MMGAGKSTVGRALARQLGCAFYDMDHMIESATGVSISTIFEIEGEIGFRKRETQTLMNFDETESYVLATGGGVVLSAENRKALRGLGQVVYLRANWKDLYERTSLDKNRPLLQAADPKEIIRELLQQRAPLYEEVAHVIVDTDHQPVQVIVEQVCRALGIQFLGNLPHEK